MKHRIVGIMTKLLAPILCGSFAVALVYIGNAQRWQGFNYSYGFWGTHWMGTFFYALSDPPTGLNIVAVVWFGYAFSACFVVQLIVVLIWRRQHILPDNACPFCGYDLTGNTTGACPECGTAMDEAAGKEA